MSRPERFFVDVLSGVAVQSLVECRLALRSPFAVGDEVRGLLEPDHGGFRGRREDAGDRPRVQVQRS